jgi:hypothetical protein
MATSLRLARSTDPKPLDISKGATEHKYPSLYQINTRVCLNELSRSLRRRATLDDVSDAGTDGKRASQERPGEQP